MFAKLCVLILSIGVTACSLLALRQQRLDAVSRAAVAQRSILLHGRDLATLRLEIGEMSAPERIEVAAASRFGPMTALGVQGGNASQIAPDGTAVAQAQPEQARRRTTPRR